MLMQMKLWSRVEDCIDEELRYKREISSRQRELLTAAFIREAGSMHRWEFISEPADSEYIPFYLSDVIDALDKDDREKLPEPVKRLINVMINGAVDYGKKQIETLLDKERRYQNYELDRRYG